MVFNPGVSDADLIDSLGGPTRVAQLLAWTDAGAVQRVSNWKRRGIPPRVRLDYPGVFAPDRVDAPAVPTAAEREPAQPQEAA
jgi:hypothetical protein